MKTKKGGVYHMTIGSWLQFWGKQLKLASLFIAREAFVSFEEIACWSSCRIGSECGILVVLINITNVERDRCVWKTISFVQSRSKRFCSQLKDNQMGLLRQTERSEDYVFVHYLLPCLIKDLHYTSSSLFNSTKRLGINWEQTKAKVWLIYSLYKSLVYVGLSIYVNIHCFVQGTHQVSTILLMQLLKRDFSGHILLAVPLPKWLL